MDQNPTLPFVACLLRCHTLGHTVPSFQFSYIFSPLPEILSRTMWAAFQPLNSHRQLTSSWLPALCVPPVYLTPAWPSRGEPSCVYHAHPLLVLPLAGAGTLWSLALNLPSDWRLTTGTSVGGKSPRLASINFARQPHSLHEFSKADGQHTLDEASVA